MNIASTEYIDKKLSAFTPGPSLKGTYEVEMDGRSLFRVGPDNVGLKVSKSNYPGSYESTEISGAKVVIENNQGIVPGKIEFGITVPVIDPGAYFNVAKGVPFKFNHGFDTGWEYDYEGSLFVNGPVKFNGTITDKNGNEITAGGGGGDYSNQIWTEVNDRYFGDKTLNYVHLSGRGGVYVNWDDKSIVSATTQTGVTFGMYSGYFNTSLVSPETLYIRPSAKSYPSVGLDISANQNSTYISGPVKFSEIYDNDGKQITAGGYSYISEDSYNISIGSDYGITTTIGRLDTSSNGNHTFIFGDSINLSSYEDMRIAGRDITFSNFSTDNSRVTFKNSVFIEGPLYLKGKEIELVEKSKTWYCRCLPLDMDVWFDSSSIRNIPYLTEAWAWEKRNAKMVFEKEMSITEVNKALCYLDLFGGPCFKTEYYSAYAVCPFDSDLEAMIPSDAQKIK